VKSIWWVREIHPLIRPPKKSNEKQKRRWHEQPVWPGSSIKGRGITACRINSRRRVDRVRLRDRSRLIHEEIGRIEYQGEQVYRTPTHNALASRMLIDQITPHLPKDNEEVNAHVKRLQAMLDAAIVADPIHD
jgi:hypothetical protein